MLNSNQLEAALLANGFNLNIDNTHARGFKDGTRNLTVFVKTSRGRKKDPLKPVEKQALVIHWAITTSPKYAALLKLVDSINENYINHNMRGYEDPIRQLKAHGIAIDVSSEKVLVEILNLLADSPAPSRSSYEDIANEKQELDKLDVTTRKAIIDARLGQGKFRTDLVKYWKTCAVTACEVEVMLRASHIKPWRHSSHTERLNQYNGLLLCANIDLAFDLGFISFQDSGQILINTTKLDQKNQKILGIEPTMSLRKCEKQHQAFLKAHRQLHHFE